MVANRAGKRAQTAGRRPQDSLPRAVTALYEPNGDGRWQPSDATRGPWDPGAQHGGAPAALLGGLIERAEPGAAMRVARVTLELVRPVPLVPLRADVEVVRPGKRVQ